MNAAAERLRGLADRIEECPNNDMTNVWAVLAMHGHPKPNTLLNSVPRLEAMACKALRSIAATL